jgi:hypothetical protein
MKNKFFWLFLLLLVFGLAAFNHFYLEESLFYLIGIIIAGLLAGIIILSIKSFLIPPAWYYKRRYGIEGAVFFTILMFFLKALEGNFSYSFSIFLLIYGFLFGFFVMGYLQKLNFNNLARRIIRDQELLKNKIIADKATFTSDNTKISGILVLTKEKLSFIPEKPEFEIVEIDLLKSNPVFNLNKKWFFIAGITVNDKNFLLSYPRLWVRKIETTHD